LDLMAPMEIQLGMDQVEATKVEMERILKVERSKLKVDFYA